jgi:hypothetical protein
MPRPADTGSPRQMAVSKRSVNAKERGTAPGPSPALSRRRGDAQSFSTLSLYSPVLSPESAFARMV